MKKQFINVSSFCLLMVLLLSIPVAQAQGTKVLPANPDFHYYLANETRTSANQIEFDLLLLNTNPAITFELGSVQAGILVNPLLYNGGNITASIVPGSSTLNSAQAPAVITFVQRKNCIKVAPKSPPGLGSGSTVSTDASNPTRICRIRLTNSKPWASVNSDLRFNFTNKPYPTKISRYVQETGLNTPLMVNDYTCFSRTSATTAETKLAIQSEESENNERLNLFPNPNNGIFTLTVKSGSDTKYDLTITNNLGVVVHKQAEFEVKGQRREEMRLTQLADGNYTIKLSNETEKLILRFIIKK